jgi:hypothetical protein
MNRLHTFHLHHHFGHFRFQIVAPQITGKNRSVRAK